MASQRSTDKKARSLLKLRNEVRSIIKEELSSDKRSAVVADLENEVENIISSVLIEHGVHKDGLSDQQEAKVYRAVCDVVDRTLTKFKTTRRPSDIEGVENYEQYMDMIE